MRWFFVLALAGVVQFAGVAAPGADRPRQLPHVSVAGREHVRIQDWAKSRGLKVRWLAWERTLQLTDEKNRILLTVNSSLAAINGVQVWLSFPVLVRYGTVYLSSLDIRTALDPILAPRQGKAGSKVAVVCLDPGHGGKDPGNHVGYQQEKDFTLLLAQEIRRQLTAAGLRVVLTRTGDRFVELADRPAFAKRSGADLFVSLHFNASEVNRGQVRGSEVYCLTPAGAYSTNTRGQGDADYHPGNQFNDKSTLLAYQIQKALVRQISVDRGVRRARFAVLREAAMPAILVEAGFLSHPAEGRKIADPKHREELARAIAGGLLAYKRSVEQP
jgi:N-acetylmuramoyl-L-alanine amidase